MRVLSETSEAERGKRSQDVVWLVEIDWPDGETRRYATRPLTIGASVCDPILLEAPRTLLAGALQLSG